MADSRKGRWRTNDEMIAHSVKVDHLEFIVAGSAIRFPPSGLLSCRNGKSASTYDNCKVALFKIQLALKLRPCLRASLEGFRRKFTEQSLIFASCAAHLRNARACHDFRDLGSAIQTLPKFAAD